ncbi:MAG: hypothetical protein DDG58_02075 [Ardenticatenia bacterium]|nr:MAG: hypothetical protein DDG58_02075 [Ardenticatenia bacterium]
MTCAWARSATPAPTLKTIAQGALCHAQPGGKGHHDNPAATLNGTLVDWGWFAPVPLMSAAHARVVGNCSTSRHLGQA